MARLQHRGSQATTARCWVQTFIKTINYSHLMPTRYNLADVDLKGTVSGEALENATAKKSANQVRCAVRLRLLKTPAGAA